MSYRVSVISIAILLVLSAACSKEKKDWEAAERTGTTESYQHFVDTYPQSTFTEVARIRIEEIDYRDAAKTNTIDSLRAFSERHPSSRFVKDAAKKLDPLAFESAKKDGTAVALEAYVGEFPEGQFAGEARMALQRLRWGFTIQPVHATAVNEISGFIESWRVKDPKKHKGVVVRATLDFGNQKKDLSTADLFLSYKTAEGKDRGICVGVAFSGDESDSGLWVFNEVDKGRFFVLKDVAEGKRDHQFLFLVPVDVNDVTLLFRDEEIGVAKIEPKKSDKT